MTKCTVCNDTGEIGQLGTLDCHHCEAATQRHNLNMFVQDLEPITSFDRDWAIHQRAVAQERVTAHAVLTEIKERSEVGDWEAVEMLRAEIKRIEP